MVRLPRRRLLEGLVAVPAFAAFRAWGGPLVAAEDLVDHVRRAPGGWDQSLYVRLLGNVPGLSSDVIACVVRLMTNDELIRVGDTVFHPLPGTQIGGRGYLAARLQPNSPTDHPDDIRWQVFDGWAYGVGDVVLGTNPVSSEPASVRGVSDVSLADLDWCLEQVMPARPAYLMVLLTKVDPMLGYLTTGFQDHVRLRRRFGCRGEPRMEAFFQRIGVLDGDGLPGPNFGDPGHVHLAFHRACGDARPDAAIRAEGQAEMAAVRNRGVFLAEGHGPLPEDLEPRLAETISTIYADAKQGIWAEFDAGFRASQAKILLLETESADRRDYILHPTGGEQLAGASQAAVPSERDRLTTQDADVLVVISDGLNPLAIMDLTQLEPFLEALQAGLLAAGRRPAPRRLVVTSGRVRVGYRIGEAAFAGRSGPRAVLHVVGERPGSGHRTFSTYLTCRQGDAWSEPAAPTTSTPASSPGSPPPPSSRCGRRPTSCGCSRASGGGREPRF